MASTYSALKIELIGTGDQAGTWGATTNVNLGTAIEEAITGSANVTFASSNVALALTDTNATQTARNLRLNLVGTISISVTASAAAADRVSRRLLWEPIDTGVDEYCTLINTNL